MTVQKFKPRGSSAAEDQRPSGDILLSASNEPLDNDKEQRQALLTSPATNAPTMKSNTCCRSSQTQPIEEQDQQQLLQQQLQFQQDQQQQQRQDSSENLLGRVLAGKLEVTSLRRAAR
ncbi:hypothetical protein HZH66_013839 [Vespula vulgaris]|uniref:Uncharacterized protein n=1 Tax=Vespula vulgaris TaxID=7454 RepID=A0A834J4N7_VESVU|nr:hypothetical protein HZH66_013839 [Vespula vulgaris]